MLFLEKVPAFLFFTGKDGVGKTSLACATAIKLADQGKHVLLVSTDPASNVGQVLNIALGHSITAVDAVSGLFALEIDPQAAAQEYRNRIVGPVRGVLPDAVVKGKGLDQAGRALLEEDLHSPCTEEIAVFQAFSRLIREAGKKFVVMDTHHARRWAVVPLLAEEPVGIERLQKLIRY